MRNQFVFFSFISAMSISIAMGGTHTYQGYVQINNQSGQSLTFTPKESTCMDHRGDWQPSPLAVGGSTRVIYLESEGGPDCNISGGTVPVVISSKMGKASIECDFGIAELNNGKSGTHIECGKPKGLKASVPEQFGGEGRSSKWAESTMANPAVVTITAAEQ